jgi:hypothetical protein
VTVHQWSGREARALRRALRMSVRGYAEHLGVAARTVSKWDSLGAGTQLRPDTQAILDTALARCDTATLHRFQILLSDDGRPAPRITAQDSRSSAYESWTEDIERAVAALNRQDFTFAASLLTRWLTHHQPHDLDDKGLYLFARSTTILGDLRRDQGAVVGRMSAHHSYTRARSLFAQLGIPRRTAQLDLSLAVVAEMSGRVDVAARRYENPRPR